MSHARTPQASAPNVRGRTIPGNAVHDVVVRYVPDAFAVQAASLALATLPFSAMSVGVHSPGASAKGFVGDRGYGVNRWAGRTPYQQGAVLYTRVRDLLDASGPLLARHDRHRAHMRIVTPGCRVVLTRQG